jgi:CheY-like chemotaxis protein
MPEVHLVPLRPDDPALGGRAVFVVSSFPCLLGRGPGCGHRLADPLVSRRHCELSLREGRVWVEDLGSRNGTSLNRLRLRGARPLADGDRLDIADCPFQARLAGTPAGAAAPGGEASPPAGRPRRVLVVEDNPDTRESLRSLLRGWGHEVEVAGDGAQGLAKALGWRPEVAVLDIGLPRLDGYEVARRVRPAAGGEVRLIALTGRGAAEDRERAFAAGFDHHLTKPADPEELRRLVATA